jgi:imidazolonepropionase-like amidohydrolase
VAAKRPADAVDAFCERIAFSPAQTIRFFEAARQGLPVELRADQLSVVSARSGRSASYSNPPVER